VTKRTRRLLVTVMAAALLFPACGSDDGGDTASTDAGADAGADAPPTEAPGDSPDDGASDNGASPDDLDAAGDGSLECAKTDDQLPDAPNRDIVAVFPVPDALTDQGDTFSETGGVTGHANLEVDAADAVTCIADLIDELGWEVVFERDPGSEQTMNGMEWMAEHPDIEGSCVSVAVFAAGANPAFGGDEGTRVEASMRSGPDARDCVY